MRTYTRIRIPGGGYFFTANLAERRGNDLLVRRISDLQEAFRQTRRDHYNPVKRGYVEAAKDWPYSSFHRWVKRGAYPIDWAASSEVTEWVQE